MIKTLRKCVTEAEHLGIDKPSMLWLGPELLQSFKISYSILIFRFWSPNSVPFRLGTFFGILDTACHSLRLLFLAALENWTSAGVGWLASSRWFVPLSLYPFSFLLSKVTGSKQILMMLTTKDIDGARMRTKDDLLRISGIGIHKIHHTQLIWCIQILGEYSYRVIVLYR